MIPCGEIIAIKHDESLLTLHHLFVNTAFTRIPVCKKNLDEIVGFLHLKDVIPYMGPAHSDSLSFDIKKIMRKPIYTARSTKCLSLLTKMRNETVHMAIVLDEHGCTEGIVTIERLVEEIIGTIKDEHDFLRPESDLVMKVRDYYLIDGKATLQEVEEKTGIVSDIWYEEEGEYQTISGFIISYLDKIPAKKYSFIHSAGLEIEIVDSDERRIKKIKLKSIS